MKPEDVAWYKPGKMKHWATFSSAARSLGVLAILLVVVWLSQGAVGYAAVGSDAEGVHNESAGLLAKRDFAGLEKLASDLKKKGYDIRQDDPELGAFYGGLKLIADDSEKTWQERLKRLAEWSAAYPNSLTPRIATADWHIGYAWRGRGTGYGDTIAPEAEATMETSAAKAAEILSNSAKGTVIDDPVYYDDWIKVCLLQGRPKEEMFGYLKKANDLAPEYELVYDHACEYLNERWYREQNESEKWMKIWADRFPPEKGDVFYGDMLTEDAHYLTEDLFKRQVDYERAKRGFEHFLHEGDPSWIRDENSLAYLAVIKSDAPLVKQTLLDLEGNVDTYEYAPDQQGIDYYHKIRKWYGVEDAMDQEMGMERMGDFSGAEKLLLSYTIEPTEYPPLAAFYERQGMKEKLLRMNFKVMNKTLKEMTEMDETTIAPDYMAELANYYAMMGEWDKAIQIARKLEAELPAAMTAKNIMLLCAIQRGDSQAERDAINLIATFKTNQPVYSAAQSVLSGRQTWDEVSQGDVFKKTDVCFPEGITAIALYSLSKGETDQARKIIEQALPNCEIDCGKTLLQSLLVGSVGRALNIIPPRLSAKGLTIISAVWGSGTSFVDVTERVNGVLGEPEIDYEVRPDWLKCDPSVGWKKALVTVFDWNGARCTLVTAEGQRFGVREMKDFLDRKK